MEDTKFKPGQRKKGGRAKGTPNKATIKVKEAILNAFEEVGGEKYLVTLAKSDPRTFCTLLGKVMPAEMKHSVEITETLRTAKEVISDLHALDDEMAEVLQLGKRMEINLALEKAFKNGQISQQTYQGFKGSSQADNDSGRVRSDTSPGAGRQSQSQGRQ